MVKAGQKLHDARISKSLSLDEIAAATKIRPGFLTAIERGEYDKLPSPAYAKGFVSNYASYLGLSQKDILALFRREFDEKKYIKVLPDSLSKSNGFSLTRVHIQQSFIVLALILLTLLGYLGYQYRAMYFPPALTINSPKQNAQISDEVVVSGTTDPNATIVVNNESVSLDTNGEFSKKLTLFPGKTSISIVAKNRFGKETSVQRDINIGN